MADSRYAGEAGLQAVFGQIKAAIAEKQDKINGMGLSHNDYSNEEKQKNAQNASDIDELKSGLMREVTTGSIKDFALTLPTKKTTFISVGNQVTGTPVAAYYVGAVIRSAISDNQLTIILVKPDNTSVYVHSYYGTWRSSWLQFTTTTAT